MTYVKQGSMLVLLFDGAKNYQQDYIFDWRNIHHMIEIERGNNV